MAIHRTAPAHKQAEEEDDDDEKEEEEEEGNVSNRSSQFEAHRSERRKRVKNLCWILLNVILSLCTFQDFGSSVVPCKFQLDEDILSEYLYRILFH